MAELLAHLALSRCPHCKIADPNVTLFNNYQTHDQSGGPAQHWGVYWCSRCGGIVVGKAMQPGGPLVDVYPKFASVDSTIPPRARTFLTQALDSLHAPSGGVMLAASAVDAMLKEKGHTDGSLHSRIEAAAKAHLITEDMAAWAHEVRLDANAERHADTSAELPSTTDAQRTIDFALALAQFLFVLPTRVAQGRQSAIK